MEVAGLTFTVAQTVLAALDCSDLRELFSRFKCEPELDKLKKTVQAIESVLQDADAKGVLNKQEQGLVDSLKNALYDADDLLDEFATVAAQEKQQLLTDEKSFRKVSKKVRRLFSRFGKLSVAYDMSREVKRIRETLDGIASDATKFCFKVDNQPIRKRREDTCSYVYQPGIIGREEDTKRVVDMLLDPNVGGHIPVLTIVGMGGLGKTALAQLVFNDSRIGTQFPFKLWACVNDEGQSQLNVDSVLGIILKSASADEKNIDGLVKEQLQRKLREKLDGKKYLLVLDDVWTEKHAEWLKLVEFLKGGRGGSRIVVTTRSKGTATAVGSVDSKLTYELEGLSDDNSWRLFEGTVGQVQANRPDLVAIGKAIVKKCANVPLAIKVIGSLLFGQDEHKWRSFEKCRLSDLEKGENDIMWILKFSYHQLSPSLKRCFNYCALFPKDHIIEKENLISLWMAQGYIELLDRGQSIEVAAEEHFLILLRRCFFQDVENDDFGNIVACKIHDLMHDVAVEVARKEICASVADFTTMSSLGETIRHVSTDFSSCTKSFFTKTKIQTYISHGYNEFRRVGFPMDAMPNMMCLRTLDMSCLKIRCLPDAIGALLHLRYLDLSNNRKLKVVPESITKLYNLQTLRLKNCGKLRVLPNDLSKLVNFRVLDITYCNGLTCMPPGMERLTHLCKLPMFVVAGRNSSSKRGVGKLEDLGPLRNLKGSLSIVFSNNYRNDKEKCEEGTAGYLSNKEHLDEIRIKWLSDEDYEEKVQEQESLLEDYEEKVQEQESLLEDHLQPHCNLRVLALDNYSGVRIPRWAREDKLATSLRNLVKIVLCSCEGLQVLPWLSKLRYLKVLRLHGLSNLEYVESKNNNISSSSSSSSPSYGATASELESPLFFPSLQQLELYNMQKLKGWSTWGVDSQPADNGISQAWLLSFFPRLSKLTILQCSHLMSIPSCPMLEYISFWSVNERLRIKIRKEDEKLGEGSNNTGGSSFSITSYPSDLVESPTSFWDYGGQIHDLKLRNLIVNNVEYLKFLTIGELRCLTDVEINSDDKVETFSGDGILKEVFRSCLSSLRSLHIIYCSKLKSVSGRGGWLKHLTALEELELRSLRELRFDENEEDGNMPWISLGYTLRSLHLRDLKKMVKLPNGMCHLTSLQSLKIEKCPLKELPEWIGSGCFSSLTTLEISDCTNALKERCQARNPQGDDWPKIEHIPCIRIS